jgi:hypothetical protein
MKRLLTAFFILAVFAAPARAADPTTVVNLVDAAGGTTTLAAGGAYTSAAVDCTRAEGYFGLQMAVSGAPTYTGTVKAEAWVSADGVTFAEPEGAADILTGMTATSGPAGNGKVYIKVQPDFCRYIKIVFTETGGASGVTIAAKLAVR